MGKRKTRQLNRAVLFIAGSLFACSGILADGDSRPATPAEKEFSKSMLSAIAKALPPGPEGWNKTGESTEIEDLQVVYTDPKEPLRLEYRVAWQDTKRIQAGRMQLNAELMKVAKNPGFTAKALEEIQKKVEPHDVKIRIDVNANITSQGITGKVAPGPAVAGGLVYRTQSEQASGKGWYEGSTYVFLGGNWKMNTSAGTYVDFMPAKAAGSSTVVQNLVVRVQADPGRAETLIQAINWEALKELIRK